ncbi:unnamed protein product [Urochloa humidicola]
MKTETPKLVSTAATAATASPITSVFKLDMQRVAFDAMNPRDVRSGEARRDVRAPLRASSQSSRSLPHRR